MKIVSIDKSLRTFQIDKGQTWFISITWQLISQSPRLYLETLILSKMLKDFIWIEEKCIEINLPLRSEFLDLVATSFLQFVLDKTQTILIDTHNLNHLRSLFSRWELGHKYLIISEKMFDVSMDISLNLLRYISKCRLMTLKHERNNLWHFFENDSTRLLYLIAMIKQFRIYDFNHLKGSDEDQAEVHCQNY